MNRLHLSKIFFDRSRIDKAIREFDGLACIDVVEIRDAYELSFSACYFDNRLTVHEFENYLIGLEATKGTSHEDL